ncbi:hypothetical protein F4813DRAFT_336404 [Daldinia decipiens]|uniref:uncharacterized protein n=1 Tax=Daldinia decipiens TaxID=326647 RepID=UPI0020C58D53|nr:uncharacterized protein F4813DRAFT_336404 [Daldinia decipiens]KAI1659546.1 hypothetical protein F4813DRAFT_336404 [Daldinia decipiens]
MKVMSVFMMYIIYATTVRTLYLTATKTHIQPLPVDLNMDLNMGSYLPTYVGRYVPRLSHSFLTLPDTYTYLRYLIR